MRSRKEVQLRQVAEQRYQDQLQAVARHEGARAAGEIRQYKIRAVPFSSRTITVSRYNVIYFFMLE